MCRPATFPFGAICFAEIAKNQPNAAVSLSAIWCTECYELPDRVCTRVHASILNLEIQCAVHTTGRYRIDIMLPRNPCTGLLGCSPLTTFFFFPFSVLPAMYVIPSRRVQSGGTGCDKQWCVEKKNMSSGSARKMEGRCRARGVGPAYVCNGLGVWELLSFLFWLSEDRGNLRCHA